MNLLGRLSAVAAICMAVACSRSPHLAAGPIQVGETPIVVRFGQPAHASGSRWELCYEFSLPGDSARAGQITAVLLDASGGRYTFVESEIDRRGEASVCRVGRLSASADYQAVELSSTVPLRLSGLRGGERR
jgi:hypothetical protein